MDEKNTKLREIMHACRALSNDMVALVDKVCVSDHWSDDQIIDIDALVTKARTSNNLDDVFLVLDGLIKVLIEARVEKKAAFTFVERKKLIACDNLLRTLVSHTQDYLNESVSQDKEDNTKEEKEEEGSVVIEQQD